MGVDVWKQVSAVRGIADVASAEPGRPLLVRGLPGSGTVDVARAVAALLDARGPEALVEAMTDGDLLEVRRARRLARQVLATETWPLPSAAKRLVEYLQPVQAEVAAAGLDDVRLLMEEVQQRECTDERAATVLYATAGRLADVVEVASFLPVADAEAGATGAVALAGFSASARRVGKLDPTVVHPWAVAVVEHHHPLLELLAAPDGARPVDAAAVVAAMSPEERRAALQLLCRAAAELPPGASSPADKVSVAAWWCEVVELSDPLEHDELMALMAGIVDSFTLSRWPEALRIADRLWRTTKVPMAGVAVAAALARSAEPDDRLRELEIHTDGKVRGVAAFTRASWHFFHDHDPAVARQVLQAASGSGPAESGLLVDGLAMIDAYLGTPEEALRRLAARPPSDEPVTPFAHSVAVMAMLTQGRHREVLDELDHELERLDQPGMNLTAERYRFFRAMAASQAGTGGDVLSSEFRDLYEQALRVGDPWSLGWTAWGAGLHAARHGRARAARRQLATAERAFHRAGRAGFAMWPAAAAAQVAALAGVPADLTDLLHPRHAVRADLADAHLAVAMQWRAAGRPAAEVAARLREAARLAADQGERVNALRVAHEQLLQGLDVDDPLAAGAAPDGVLAETWPAIIDADGAAERAAQELVQAGWVVLGVRHLARLAERARRDDPRRATRLLQQVRDASVAFDQPLAAWAVPSVARPTLSTRKREIAAAGAGGEGRKELAGRLRGSRRRWGAERRGKWSKLRISSRSELREWLALH